MSWNERKVEYYITLSGEAKLDAMCAKTKQIKELVSLKSLKEEERSKVSETDIYIWRIYSKKGVWRDMR